MTMPVVSIEIKNDTFSIYKKAMGTYPFFILYSYHGCDRWGCLQKDS